MAQLDGIDEDVAVILGLKAEMLWPCAPIEAPAPRSKSPASAPLVVALIALTGAVLVADRRPKPARPSPAVDATATRGADHPPLAQTFVIPPPGSARAVTLAGPASVAASSQGSLHKGRRAPPTAKATRLAALAGAHSHDAPAGRIDPERRSLSVSDLPTRATARDVVLNKVEPAVERVERLEAIDAIKQLRQK